VDKQERIKARSVVDTKAEAQFDVNGDGVLDATEGKAFMKARKARSAAKENQAETSDTIE